MNKPDKYQVGVVKEPSRRFDPGQDSFEAGHTGRVDYLRAFAQARVANAILVLMEEPDPLMAAVRSAYECHAACGDWRWLIDVTQLTLTSPTPVGNVKA